MIYFPIPRDVEVQVQRAVAQAEALLRAVLEELPPLRNIRDALDQGREVEEKYEQLASQFELLREAGQLDPQAEAALLAVRTNVWRVQRQLAERIRAIFADRHDILVQLPLPPSSPPPLVVPPPPNYADTQPQAPVGTSGLRGPEVAPAVAAGAAAGLSGWMVVGIILAVLVGLGLIAYITYQWAMSSEALRDVLVTKEQIKALREMYQARTQFIENCRAQGQTIEQCSALARQTFPTPNEAGVTLPSGAGGWIPFALGAGAVLLLIGGGVWLGYRAFGRRRVYHDEIAGVGEAPRFHSPKFRALSEREFLDKPDRYGLEVE